MKKILYSAVAATLLLVACNSADKSEDQNAEGSEAPKTLTFDVNKATLRWTAFKFTEKVGVGGGFDNVSVTAGGSGSAESVLINGTFSIEEQSVNSNNEIRDPKIKQQFFGNTIGEAITGKVLSAENGKGQLEINMNEISKTVDYSYTNNDTALVLKANLDVLNWNATVALDSLNIVCEALHKGEDGLSKLWPDVEVEVVIPITDQQY